MDQFHPSAAQSLFVSRMDEHVQTWTVDELRQQLGFVLGRQAVFERAHDVGMHHQCGDFTFAGFIQSLEAAFKEGELFQVAKFQSHYLVILAIAGRVEFAHRAADSGS